MARPLPQWREGIDDVRVAIPDGKYRPVVIPTANKPSRMLQGPVQNEVPIKASPSAVLDMMMVRLWLQREDTTPDPIRVIKYPREIIKNRAPVSAWVRFRSISMWGARGAGVIRDTKLRKKMPKKGARLIDSERRGRYYFHFCWHQKALKMYPYKQSTFWIIFFNRRFIKSLTNHYTCK